MPSELSDDAGIVEQFPSDLSNDAGIEEHAVRAI